MEECGFSHLHNVVLGIDPSPLEEEVTKNDLDINVCDSAGRTALNWAIQRKDAWAVNLLLRAGADPNICTQSSPLQFAAWNSDLRCVKLLLGAGAIASYRDRNGYNALAYAARKATDVEIFKVLISAGLSIKERNSYGATPLVSAASQGNVYGIRALLDYGATLNEQDIDGDTALMSACFPRHHESVQYLLDRGADYTLSNHDGNTILHYVALSGDLETLNILRAANLAKIDPQKLNKDGKTAFQLAQGRLSKPRGFIELFLTLIWEIRNRNDYLAGHHSRSDGTSPTRLGPNGDNGDTMDPPVSTQSEMSPLPTSVRQSNEPKLPSTL